VQADTFTCGPEESLFVSLAEQIHISFMQIMQLAALETPESSRAIRDISQAAMQLTESYALSVRLQNQSLSPVLQPVAVNAVIRETVTELLPLAKLLNVQLALFESGRFSPALADPVILKAALTSLGQVFLLAESQNDKAHPISFGVHRSRYGLVAGLYGMTNQLSAQAYRRAQTLHRQAAQPLQTMISGPATGVFVAENLLASMSSKLHVARYKNMTGLAVTLSNCDQLALV